VYSILSVSQGYSIEGCLDICHKIWLEVESETRKKEKEAVRNIVKDKDDVNFNTIINSNNKISLSISNAASVLTSTNAKSSIFDATCYLIKLSKGYDDALNFVLKDIRRNIELLNTTTTNCSNTSIKNENEMNNEEKRFKEIYQICIQRTQQLSNLCKEKQQEENDTELWFKALTFYLIISKTSDMEVGLNEMNKYDILVSCDLTNTLLRDFVEAMCKHMKAQDILSNIHGRYLVEFRDVLQKIFLSYCHDTEKHSIVKKIKIEDLKRLKAKLITTMKRGKVVKM